jgi:hypothetical protein
VGTLFGETHALVGASQGELSARRFLSNQGQVRLKMENHYHVYPIAQADEMPTEPRHGGLFIWTMLTAVLLGGLLLRARAGIS